MRLNALTLGYVLNTHIIGVECLENFYGHTKVREPISSAGLGKIQKISGGQKKMKKVDFGGQNDLKNNFSKCF